MVYVMNLHTPLKYFKLFPEAFPPEWGSTHAACFDFKACLIVNTEITVYQADNFKTHSVVCQDTIIDKAYLNIFPSERVMVPTGLILDIPLGYSVRIHPRSGIALKNGLVMANQEGVIDPDYVEPTFILLYNQSTTKASIYHGDRIAQGEMIILPKYNIEETSDKPLLKSERKGGFGSTGV